MLPMLKKHTFITTALIASLGLTACGSKKDVFNKQETPKAEGNDNTTQTDKNKIGGGIQTPNAGSGKSNTEPPRVPPDMNDLPNPGQGNPSQPPKTQTPPPPPPPSPAPVKPTTPPVTDTKPAPAPGTNTLPPDYRSNDWTNVDRDGLSKRMTGGVTADGLVYTGSSTDELLNYLRARNQRVDENTRQANLAAAASVLSAKLVVDGPSGDAIVTLKIQEGRDVKVYNVAGAMAADYAAPLKSVRAGNGEKSTGTSALEGTLKCLDLDGGCETTFVRLKIGSPGSSAILNIVFRNSVSDLFFEIPASDTVNPEFLILRECFRNTIQRQNSDNRIKTARISSFEVVNGRSGVALTLKGVNNELLGFSGPLLAPEAGSRVNINLSRIAKDQDDSLDLISLDRSQLNYANWIGDARMVANNGLGQVKVALKLRKRGNYSQETFLVTFMRRIKPVVDLTDDNLK